MADVVAAAPVLISCITMGFAAVVLEGALSHYFLKRRLELTMLGNLAKAVVPLQAAYILLRLGDVIARGVFAFGAAADGLRVLFWFELALFAAPIVMLRGRLDSAHLPQRDGADRRGRPVRFVRSWSRFSPAIITAIFRASAS